MGGRTEVLDAATDAEQWLGILTRFPREFCDIYFSPEYIQLHCLNSNCRALLFTYSEEDSVWSYPFVLQAITHVGQWRVDGGLCDIETAYGYGGPLCNSEDSGFLARAHGAFDEWSQANKVVAEFVRFHPILGNQKWSPGKVDVLPDRQTVSIDLGEPGCEGFTFEPKVRNKLRRTQQLGAVVSCELSDENYDMFLGLYKNTMDRLDAEDSYYFNDAYFDGLRRLIVGSGFLLMVKLEDVVVAAAIFLKGEGWLHYHLSATDPMVKVPGAINLLVVKAAQLGREQNLRGLHLGGGRSAAADDSLLRFKRSMGSITHGFYIGRRVHDMKLYKELCAQWRSSFPQLVERYAGRVLCYRMQQ